MLFGIDFHEDFIDEKGIAVASVFSLQPSSVYSIEFDTPKSNGFAADSDASLCQKIFYIAVTEVETSGSVALSNLPVSGKKKRAVSISIRGFQPLPKPSVTPHAPQAPNALSEKSRPSWLGS